MLGNVFQIQLSAYDQYCYLVRKKDNPRFFQTLMLLTKAETTHIYWLHDMKIIMLARQKQSKEINSTKGKD